MLSYAELVDIERSLRGQRVLSAYVGGPPADPAARHGWRRAVDDELSDVRRSLGDAPHAEREAFERAAALLAEQLATTSAPEMTPGWAAFVTADAVWWAGPVPAVIPPLVAWGTGARVAPAVRAVEQERPVWVAVVDNRKARLYRCHDGELEVVDTLRAHTSVGPLDHMGAPPHEHFHSGTRGSTGTDAAEQELREATNRLLTEVAERLATLSAHGGWIVIGGTRQAAHTALDALPARIAARATILPAIDVSSTTGEIQRLAEEGASLLRRSRDDVLLAGLFDDAGSGGNGAVGAPDVLHALDAGAVQELLLSPRFVERQPTEAEAAVRAAFDQRSAIEMTSGPVADRLDRDGGGIAARLRFVPPPPTPAPSDARQAAR
jgi:hypothetical protein